MLSRTPGRSNSNLSTGRRNSKVSDRRRSTLAEQSLSTTVTEVLAKSKSSLLKPDGAAPLGAHPTKPPTSPKVVPRLGAAIPPAVVQTEPGEGQDNQPTNAVENVNRNVEGNSTEDQTESTPVAHIESTAGDSSLFDDNGKFRYPEYYRRMREFSAMSDFPLESEDHFNENVLGDHNSEINNIRNKHLTWLDSFQGKKHRILDRLQHLSKSRAQNFGSVYQLISKNADDTIDEEKRSLSRSSDKSKGETDDETVSITESQSFEAGSRRVQTPQIADDITNEELPETTSSTSSTTP